MLLSSNMSFAQSTVQKDEEMLKSLIQDSFDEIWSNRDSKSIEKYYTKDFLLLENGAVWTNDSISYHLERNRSKKILSKRENTFDFVSIKVGKIMAWLAYQNYATITREDGSIRKIHWLESATAIRTDKGWKLQMLHSTRTKK
ncbi:nuclear transport factor 2 family protein [Ancylomarina longa]|uniref:Nuclear transport factor 2 family protein n=1 Tax=Ancylomarina longa TaxID=2487017 RepID=A0A434AVA9_9BACT|nr:nuclear transport factor 2 family protein [Ancylomarina longa]